MAHVAPTPAPNPDRTAWGVVVIATFAGAAVAMQIGKVGVAMPLLRDEFPVGVATASVYLSCISLLAALFGAMFGSLAFGIGVRRTALAGLALMAVASVLGGLAPGVFLLMTARTLEAVALPLVVTAMPAIVQAATGRNRSAITFGIWAGWLPIGLAMGMFLGFFVLDDLGWRGFYFLCAVPPVVALLLLLAVPVDLPRHLRAQAFKRPRLRGLGAPVGQMALVYGMFSASYLTFAGFLPSVAVDDLGFSARGVNVGGFGRAHHCPFQRCDRVCLYPWFQTTPLAGSVTAGYGAFRSGVLLRECPSSSSDRQRHHVCLVCGNGPCNLLGCNTAPVYGF